MAAARKPSAKPAASPSPSPEAAALPSERIETYDVIDADGNVVTVTRNIDTGEATYSPK